MSDRKFSVLYARIQWALSKNICATVLSTVCGMRSVSSMTTTVSLQYSDS